MFKAEYDGKMSHIANRFEDLISELNMILREARETLSELENLPELNELEDINKED